MKEAVMSRSSNKATLAIRNRKAANGLGTRRTTINNAVKAVTTDVKVRKAVTNALRTNAKKLRDSEKLGTVKGKVCRVADGVRGVRYTYTNAQVRKIAADYKPRNAEYKVVRAALLAA